MLQTSISNGICYDIMFATVKTIAAFYRKMISQFNLTRSVWVERSSPYYHQTAGLTGTTRLMVKEVLTIQRFISKI